MEDDFYTKLDRQLYRINTKADTFRLNRTNESDSLFVSPDNIDPGLFSGGIEMTGGTLQSYKFRSGAIGWNINPDGTAEFQNVNIGTKVITIDTSQDIQDAIDTINTAGGGVLRLKAGTYTQTSDITLPSSVQLEGENTSTTKISFSGAYGIVMTGTNVYTTGTLSVNQGSTSVTGSGTTWTAAMIGRQIFISNRWYVIANVGSATSITLASAFADSNVSGGSYRIASVIKDIEIKEITLQSSSGTAISGTDVRDLLLEDVDILSNNKGISLTNFYQIQVIRVAVAASTSNGVELTNGTFFNPQQLASVSNGGSGFVLSTVRSCPFLFCAANANTADGFNITDADNCSFSVEASGNGGQGLEFVSGSDNNKIFDCIVNGNTSDGIKFTATCDNNVVSLSTITSNGAYGVNIAASTCDNTIVDISNIISGNVIDSISDSGSGTQLPNSHIRYFIAAEAITKNNAVYLFQPTTLGTGTIENTHSIDLEASSSQYLQAADSTSLSFTGDLTVEMWVRLESVPSVGQSINLVEKMEDGSGQYSWMIQYEENSGLQFRMLAFSDGTNNLGTATKAHTLSAGTWTHLAFVRTQSSGDWEIFVNGASIGTSDQTSGTIFNSTSDVRVGGQPTLVGGGQTATYFDGMIDDVRIWSSARSSTEIAAYYLQSINTATNLVASWQLNNSLADASGNSNTLTNNGAASFTTTVPWSLGVLGVADANVAGKFAGFIGFALKTVAAGDTTPVSVSGEVKGFSSLSTGTQYYLSDTAGAIATSAGTNSRKVGIATSTTTLLITNVW